jgi:hypothetical protein
LIYLAFQKEKYIIQLKRLNILSSSCGFHWSSTKFVLLYNTKIYWLLFKRKNLGWPTEYVYIICNSVCQRTVRIHMKLFQWLLLSSHLYYYYHYYLKNIKYCYKWINIWWTKSQQSLTEMHSSGENIKLI